MFLSAYCEKNSLPFAMAVGVGADVVIQSGEVRMQQLAGVEPCEPPLVEATGLAVLAAEDG